MSLINEKAYKLLYEKYRSTYVAIVARAQNVSEYGNQEDKSKFVETIVNQKAHPHISIMSETDIKIVEMLEYLVDDEEPVR